ncbi:MAG: ATP-grasp domain-containing protein, partial [Bacteroidales bacterium]|nr:ATP-grasp domain-containing protein [Bacteroidales bacterium]
MDENNDLARLKKSDKKNIGKKKSMITDIYILGNHIQGLGVSRNAARQGYKVTLFNKSSLSVARFSNTCNKFVKFKNTKHLLQILLQDKIESKKALLVPTNDALVGFLSENYEKLNQKYFLSIPPEEITQIAFNKRKTYKAAVNAGIPIPESYFPDNEKELLEISEKIKYPVIIKPAVMHDFYAKSGKKVFKCTTKNELIVNYRRAIKIIDKNEIIVQEMLDGGAKNLYSFASYAKNGEVLGSFVANRIRQKPMDFGVATTFVISVINDRVEELAKKFLKHINYTGLSEVEFMYDAKSNDYKLIEINPRTWKWHSMANIVGINLIKMMIDDLQGKNIKPIANTKINVAWVEQLTDFYIVFTEIIKGKMRLSDYYKTWKLKKEYATFDIKDP